MRVEAEWGTLCGAMEHCIKAKGASKPRVSSSLFCG